MIFKFRFVNKDGSTYSRMESSVAPSVEFLCKYFFVFFTKQNLVQSFVITLTAFVYTELDTLGSRYTKSQTPNIVSIHKARSSTQYTKSQTPYVVGIRKAIHPMQQVYKKLDTLCSRYTKIQTPQEVDIREASSFKMYSN